MQHIVLISSGSSIHMLRMADLIFSTSSRFISHTLGALTTIFGFNEILAHLGSCTV